MKTLSSFSAFCCLLLFFLLLSVVVKSPENNLFVSVFFLVRMERKKKKKENTKIYHYLRRQIQNKVQLGNDFFSFEFVYKFISLRFQFDRLYIHTFKLMREFIIYIIIFKALARSKFAILCDESFGDIILRIKCTLLYCKM